MIDLFTRREFNGLLQPAENPCVSMFLATHPTGRESAQDATALKNLMSDAEQQLEKASHRDIDMKALLADLRDLPNSPTIWSHRTPGLAAFAAPGFFAAYRCPQPFTNSIFVDERFRIRPLLPLLEQGDFHLLAISENAVQFYAFNEFSIEPILVPNLPASMKESLNYASADRGSQVHSSSRVATKKQSGVFHGQGGEPDTRETDLAAYCKLINQAVTGWLGESTTPLIVAAVERLAAAYRQQNSYDSLIDEIVKGSPDRTTAQKLHQSAWTLGADWRDAQASIVAREFVERRGVEVSDDWNAIVTAAASGRVKSLFYDPKAELFGQVDADSRQATVTGKASDRDLIEMAATETLRCGGSIQPMEKLNLPTNSPLAAVFRY